MSNIASRGSTMAVDWEQRIDFARFERIGCPARRRRCAASDLGALLLFDPNNIRYVTSTHIGEWARDKNARFVLVPRSGDPILWDFGSAARHHQLYAPWLPPESFRGGVSPMRGAMPDETGMPDTLARTIIHELARAGARRRAGRDRHDRHRHSQRAAPAGVSTADGSQVMLPAREIKTEEEVALLDHAAAIVDAVYERIYEMLRPGVTERQVVAEAHRLLFELGSEQVEAINAVSGDRCNPHPARVLRPAAAPRRPGVLRHHPLLHGLSDVLLPHVQRGRHQPGAARRLQAVPGVAGRSHRPRQARRHHRRDRRRVADRAGTRIRR